METIEVRYKILGSIGGQTYYHKYLVYTDTLGDVVATRGGPTHNGGIVEASGAQTDISSHDPYGEIQVQTGAFNASFPDYNSSGSDPSEVIATGSDLSTQWATIITAMNAIGDNHWAYLPVTQNSNTTVDYALLSAGLSAPALDGKDHYWAPGSGDPFTVSYETSGPIVLPDPVHNDVQPAVSDAVSTASPLVIDLSSSHTGIALTTFSASTTTTFFDLNDNGFAVQTAWVSGDTGLLARDLNSNGKIDSSAELFGSPTVDGFARLAALDSNHDLRIDSNDSAWSSLVVWKDTNGDAVTQSGELYSLSSLNIASIDLAGVASSTSTISGNPISHVSTVTFTGGATAAIDDAWFVHDNTNSYYTGDYTLDTDTLFLPALRGFGTIPDLTIAMSQDSDLKDLVSDFVSGFSLTDLIGARDAATDILYKWAGVDGVSPTSRGSYIDAQHLEFLEHFVGSEFEQTQYYGSNSASDPRPDAAGYLEKAYETAFNMILTALFVQTGIGSLFDGPVAYNPATGTVTGDTDLSHSAVTALATDAPTSGPDNLDFWLIIASVIDNTKGISSLTLTEQSWLSSAVTTSNGALDWATVVNDFHDIGATNSISGTSGADTLTGGTANDTIHGYAGNDTIHGGVGNDTIYGDDGDNILYGDAGDDYVAGGTGNDILYGGDGNDDLHGGYGNDTYYAGAGGNTINSRTGNDTFVYGGGHDVISEYGGTDQIILPSGITLGDLTFSRVSTGNSHIYFDDLLIQVDGSGSIQIAGHFQSGGYLAVETLVFSDTSTLNLSTLAPDVVLTNGDDNYSGSSNGNYAAYGFDGNDTIYTSGTGAHTIDGGNGNDILQGGSSSNETYIASPGFDEIRENSGTDTIVVPTEYTIDDVTFYRINDGSGPTNSLGISIEGLGEIKVLNQFSSTAWAVEYMHFLHDSSTITLTDLSITTMGTSGNDSLTPPTTDAGTNDIMDGREGNDNLNGGTGNDTYIYSAGHDTINETASGSDDTIRVRDSYTPSDISMFFDANQDLQLLDSDGNNMTVYQQGLVSSYGVEHVAFADSTVWNLGSMEIETHGTSGNDYLHGSDYGDASSNDTIYGYAGNDSIYGGSGNDLIYGGDGDDFIYASGSGGSDTVHGDAGADTLYGVADSVLYGDDGNDTLYNNADWWAAGSTAVTLNGGDGADNLWGGYGQTIMDGGNGADTLHGGSDVDIFKFDSATAFNAVDTVQSFNQYGGDKIDLSNILEGHYDPLHDLITNFVQIQTNGSNSEVFVDTTGTATFGSAEHIATIVSVTGLTDEAALVTAGTLIAA